MGHSCRSLYNCLDFNENLKKKRSIINFAKQLRDDIFLKILSSNYSCAPKKWLMPNIDDWEIKVHECKNITDSRRPISIPTQFWGFYNIPDNPIVSDIKFEVVKTPSSIKNIYSNYI